MDDCGCEECSAGSGCLECTLEAEKKWLEIQNGKKRRMRTKNAKLDEAAEVMDPETKTSFAEKYGFEARPMMDDDPEADSSKGYNLYLYNNPNINGEWIAGVVVEALKDRGFTYDTIVNIFMKSQGANKYLLLSGYGADELKVYKDRIESKVNDGSDGFMTRDGGSHRPQCEIVKMDA